MRFSICVALVIALLGMVQAGSAGDSEATIGQIKETLQNLLRSVEESGRDAEQLFTKKQNWCASSSPARARAVGDAKESQAQLLSDLKEHEAAVEEQQAVVEQVKSDIEVVNTAINRTIGMKEQRLQADSAAQAAGPESASMLQFSNRTGTAQLAEDERDMSALLRSKRQSLLNLQNELEGQYPLLAMKQELAAETKRRIDDLQASISTDESLVSALEADCVRSAKVADAQASSRVGEANGIEMAVQDLAEQLAAATAPAGGRSLRGNAPVLLQAPPSFLQMSGRSTKTTKRHQQVPLTLVQTRQTFTQASRSNGDGRTKAGIQTLIKSLSQEKSEVREHRVWCTQETEKSELSRREISDRADRLSASIQAHNDAIEQLGGDLTQLQTETATLQTLADQASANGAAETTLVTAQLKDQKLAVRILDQAIAILTNYQISHAVTSDGGPASLLQTASRLALQKRLDGAAQATEALKGTRNEFTAQVKAAQADGATKTAGLVKQAAQEALAAKERQRRNADMAKARHEEALAQESEENQQAQRELSEAQSYSASLEKDCGKASVSTYQNADRRKQEQVGALTDAVKVLNGEQVTLSPDVAALGETDTAPVDMSKLSPMERAAAEMGVATN